MSSFDLFFIFLRHQVSTYLAHPIDSFTLLIENKHRRILRFLFGTTPDDVDLCSRHFDAINQKQNDEQILGWNIYY